MTRPKFREFPKWINTPDGQRHLVKNPTEELNTMAPFKEKQPVVQVAEDMLASAVVNVAVEEVPAVEDAPAEAEPEATAQEFVEVGELECDQPTPDEKEALIARAEALGVIYDKRWGVGRLVEAIRKAENTPKAAEPVVGEKAEE